MNRVIFLTLILLAGYYSLIALHVLPPGVASHMKDMGVVTASEYVHRPKAPELALVGTSKTYYLRANYFDADTANLGVPGQTTLTGLTILDRSERLTPKIVLVELNRLAVRGPAETEVDKYMKNPPSGIADIVLDLRNRPVNVLFGLVRPWASEGRREANQSADRWLAMVNPRPYSYLNDAQKSNLVAQCAQIKSIIKRLEARGAKVILFDVPVDERVSSSVADWQVREYLAATFPQAEYSWIPDADGEFETTDLCHLTDQSAMRFVAHLKKQIEEHQMIAANRRRSM